MTDYWTPMVVEQFIPNVMMTPLDSFLLTRIFESAQYEDGVYFFAEEWPGELIFLFDDEPDHLLEAIEKTKDIDPELCADVKRAMQTDGDTVERQLLQLRQLLSRVPGHHPPLRRQAAIRHHAGSLHLFQDAS